MHFAPSDSRTAAYFRRFRFDESGIAPRRTNWKKLCVSLSFSCVMHTTLLIVLSLIIFHSPTREVLDSLICLIIDENSSAAPDIGLEVDSPLESATSASMPDGDEADPIQEILGATASTASATDVTVSPARQKSESAAPPSSPLASTSKPVPKAKSEVVRKGFRQVAEGELDDHFTGRSAASKAALLKRMGGTDASEAAVARGLVWLKNHQLPAGCWSFDHVHGPDCDCTMSGRLANNLNGATAMALLAFLGAGHTHLEGEHQDEVRRGLEFLMKNGVPVGKGICFYGQLSGPQTYYTHGLVTIALSEAFAMSHDADLRPAIAGAIEYLVATQHLQGGWRYAPGQPGDTSVVAWELMALKSAQFSRIPIPNKVFAGIDRFLASVSSLRGSRYAYLPERKMQPTPSMTAAGLLCRMYLNWDKTSGALQAGVNFLDEFGPDPDDMYYNYYATQVMHHWGGEEWDRWNRVMREHLINTQVRRTHAAGSWDVADRHGNMGGRLYMTSLALLTLEVYYRHLPLYQQDRIEVPLMTPDRPAKK